MPGPQPMPFTSSGRSISGSGGRISKLIHALILTLGLVQLLMCGGESQGVHAMTHGGVAAAESPVAPDSQMASFWKPESPTVKYQHDAPARVSSEFIVASVLHRKNLAGEADGRHWDSKGSNLDAASRPRAPHNLNDRSTAKQEGADNVPCRRYGGAGQDASLSCVAYASGVRRMHACMHSHMWHTRHN